MVAKKPNFCTPVMRRRERLAHAAREPGGDIAVDGVALGLHRAALGQADRVGDLDRSSRSWSDRPLFGGSLAFGRRLLELEGIDQRAVDQQVGIAADRRGEVRVAAEREAEVAGVLRAVVGLGLAAQHRFHHQRLLGLDRRCP